MSFAYCARKSCYSSQRFRDRLWRDFVGDGIARIYGLENVMQPGELIEFAGGVSGIALNLEEGFRRRGDARRLHQHREGRRGQAHAGRIMSISVGGHGRPRSRCAGKSGRWQGRIEGLQHAIERIARRVSSNGSP